MENNISPEVQKIAEGFQDECHAMVKNIMNNATVEYQDATNIYMFVKLAEFEKRLQAIEKHSSLSSTPTVKS